MQGDPSTSGYLKTMTTCKHFAGFNLGTTIGQDGKFTQAQTFNALISEQDMADTFLPAFRACVKEAKGASVMCSCTPRHSLAQLEHQLSTPRIFKNAQLSAVQFDEHIDNAVNGRPSCGNRWLLQEVLRDEWGHEGHVVSDVRVLNIFSCTHGRIGLGYGCHHERFIICKNRPMFYSPNELDDLFSVCSAEACQI